MVPTHFLGVVHSGDVNHVHEFVVQKAIRWIWVAPCQQPCIGDIVVNCELIWSLGLHWGGRGPA